MNRPLFTTAVGNGLGEVEGIGEEEKEALGLEVKEGLEDGVIEEDGVDDRDRLEVKEGLEDGGIEED